jgi:ADP-ribosylglycohydrolase
VSGVNTLYMIGAIIGDVVGSRFEFNNTNKIDFELLTKESTFTDDTVCTVAVADFILKAGKYGIMSGDRFADVLQSWCNKYPGRGYGSRFQNWIIDKIPYNSFGNGAAMRISPVGLFAKSERDLDRLVKMVTSVSHDHPEGVKGAYAVAMAISMARQSYSKIQIKDGIRLSFGYNLDMDLAEVAEFSTLVTPFIPERIAVLSFRKYGSVPLLVAASMFFELLLIHFPNPPGTESTVPSYGSGFSAFSCAMNCSGVAKIGTA